MSDFAKGFWAMLGACVLWGLSPIYYDALSHVPPLEVLGHRGLWSLLTFLAYLGFQGRLTELRDGFGSPRRFAILTAASAFIAINWFVFIVAIQEGRTTEAALGYYVYPLVAVMIGRFWFRESLRPAQMVAVLIAAAAVGILSAAHGALPWIALVLAASFALYGAIKKELPLRPTISVTLEVLLFLPVGVALLAFAGEGGTSAFLADPFDAVLLAISGLITALPLIFFSYAMRRVRLSTSGLMFYATPTLHFLVAVLVLGEPFAGLQILAFGLIWIALAVYSLASLRAGRMSGNPSRVSGVAVAPSAGGGPNLEGEEARSR